jgi:hypothetical protein
MAKGNGKRTRRTTNIGSRTNHQGYIFNTRSLCRPQKPARNTIGHMASRLCRLPLQVPPPASLRPSQRSSRHLETKHGDASELYIPTSGRPAAPRSPVNAQLSRRWRPVLFQGLTGLSMSTWQASREEYETHLVHDGQAPRRRIPARHLPLASGRWSCRLGKHRSSSSGQPTFMPTFPPSGTIQDAGSQPQVGLELNPTSSKNIRLCREHSVGVARENHRQERRMVPTSHTNTLLSVESTAPGRDCPKSLRSMVHEEEVG